MDKKGGRPFDSKNAAVTEFESTIRVHSLVDACGRIVNLHNIGFTWSNPSMKIQTRSDYFFIPKVLQKLIQECRIMPNIFSDHSALIRFDYCVIKSWKAFASIKVTDVIVTFEKPS